MSLAYFIFFDIVSDNPSPTSRRLSYFGPQPRAHLPTRHRGQSLGTFPPSCKTYCYNTRQATTLISLSACLTALMMPNSKVTIQSSESLYAPYALKSFLTSTFLPKPNSNITKHLNLSWADYGVKTRYMCMYDTCQVSLSLAGV